MQRPVHFHVYIYIILNTKLRTLKFMTETRRKKEETVVSRFNEVTGEWTCEVHTDVIGVKWRTFRVA